MFNQQIHKLAVNLKHQVVSLIMIMTILVGGSVTFPSSVLGAADCTPGNQVNISFWTDVIKRINELERKVVIKDSNFATPFLQAWAPYENTKACWNPLATTWDTGKGTWTIFNKSGVKSYTERQWGVRATAASISSKNTANDMSSIRQMLAGNGFEKTKITSALKKWTGNGAYVPNLVAKWEKMYPKK